MWLAAIDLEGQGKMIPPLAFSPQVSSRPGGDRIVLVIEKSSGDFVTGKVLTAVSVSNPPLTTQTSKPTLSTRIFHRQPTHGTLMRPSYGLQHSTRTTSSWPAWKNNQNQGKMIPPLAFSP